MITANIDKTLNIAINAESMDINNADIIMKEMKKEALSNASKDIVVDLGNVRFVDSSAIAILVKFVQSLVGSRRKISFVNASESVLYSVNVLKLTKFLNFK
ncbi:MAG: STAS domain-containing protein [Spirochaetota bacterium]